MQKDTASESKAGELWEKQLYSTLVSCCYWVESRVNTESKEFYLLTANKRICYVFFWL